MEIPVSQPINSRITPRTIIFPPELGHRILPAALTNGYPLGGVRNLVDAWSKIPVRSRSVPGVDRPGVRLTEAIVAAPEADQAPDGPGRLPPNPSRAWPRSSSGMDGGMAAQISGPAEGEVVRT